MLAQLKCNTLATDVGGDKRFEISFLVMVVLRVNNEKQTGWLRHMRLCPCKALLSDL